MIRYTLEDATLQLPDDCRVAFVVTAPPAPGETFACNLVVTRDRLRPNEDLAGYVDRQLHELAKGLKRFKLHGRRDVEVDGTAGHEILCGCQGSQGPLEQRLTFLPRGAGGVLTFTATVTKARSQLLFPLFDEIVQTARLPVAEKAP